MSLADDIHSLKRGIKKAGTAVKLFAEATEELVRDSRIECELNKIETSQRALLKASDYLSENSKENTKDEIKEAIAVLEDKKKTLIEDYERQQIKTLEKQDIPTRVEDANVKGLIKSGTRLGIKRRRRKNSDS